MAEKEVVDVEDIDRESLVKDIEQIRRTLGSVANSKEPESTSEVDATDEYEPSERDSEDSDDDLAIIRSPRYRESTDEESQLKKQRMPADIVSTESDNETADDSNIGNIQIIPFENTCSENSDTCEQVAEQVSYQTSGTYAHENTDEVDVILTPIDINSRNGNAQPEEHQGMIMPGSTTLQAISKDCVISTELHPNGYTLTELQPAIHPSPSANRQNEDDNSWNPVYGIDIPLTHVRQNGCLPVGELSSQEQQGTGEVGVDHVDDPDVLQQDDDPALVEVKSEVHRCLNLNRQYQAVIQQELRRIERLLLENREKQLGLTHVTQAALLQAEVLAFKQLTSYVKPYFRDKSKNNQGPPPNEDTSLRISLKQPSPFQRPAKSWPKEDIDALADGVRTSVLETKLTPLMQRVDVITPRRYKTKEEEKELEQLKAEIQRIKGLPFVTLVENYNRPIDWVDITDKVLPSRTQYQCKIYWYNELHPLLNKNDWTKEEDKKLVELVKEADAEDWGEISRKLMTNRSAVQCLRRYQKYLNRTFMKSKWSVTEDNKLLETVKICGLGAWEKVSSLLEGRTGSQCMQRYVKSVNPIIKKGKWNGQEDDLLRKGIEKFGPNWAKIRSLIPHRTDSQIRERWSDVLDPSINKGPWTSKEDETLLDLVDELGTKNWSKIASHLKGRNDNRCCRRWRFLIRYPELQPGYFPLCRGKDAESMPSMTQIKDKPSPNQAAKMLPGASKTTQAIAPPNINKRATESLTAQPNVTKPKQTANTSTSVSKTTQPVAPSYAGKRAAKSSAAPLNIERTKTTKKKRPTFVGKSRNVSTNVTKRTRASQKKGSRKTNVTNSNVTRKNARTKRVTKPSPIVVSQATALPNSLPMNYLTQFSVLLQAFSVDVSGALENVRSPGQHTQAKSQSCRRLSEPQSSDDNLNDAHSNAKNGSNSQVPSTDNSATGVVLSDSRHGLTHDIVFTCDSDTEKNPQKSTVVETCRPGRLKRTTTSRNSPAKKQKTGLQENTDRSVEIVECEDSDDDDGIEEVNTTALPNLKIAVKRRRIAKSSGEARYPVRSTRGQRASDPVLKNDAGDKNNERANEKQLSKKKRNEDKQGKNDSTTSNSGVTFAAPVPPLPPSATTLNAFRKLLVLRKQLQSQANRCGGNEILSAATSKKTCSKDPHAQRKLSISCPDNALPPEVSNSIPYQQLLNRFNSMFLWPGFLSIVNPDSARKPSQSTTRTSINSKNSAS